jgi:hypothetical protein
VLHLSCVLGNGPLEDFVVFLEFSDGRGAGCQMVILVVHIPISSHSPSYRGIPESTHQEPQQEDYPSRTSRKRSPIENLEREIICRQPPDRDRPLRTPRERPLIENLQTPLSHPTQIITPNPPPPNICHHLALNHKSQPTTPRSLLLISTHTLTYNPNRPEHPALPPYKNLHTLHNILNVIYMTLPHHTRRSITPKALLEVLDHEAAADFPALAGCEVAA